MSMQVWLLIKHNQFNQNTPELQAAAQVTGNTNNTQVPQSLTEEHYLK